MAQEVDSLNARVVEAETRLKSEVTKIKKKMTITITELELQIDTINKSNIDLQKLSKKQSIQLQVRKEIPQITSKRDCQDYAFLVLQ